MAKTEILNNDAMTLRVAEGSLADKAIEQTEQALEVASGALDFAEEAVERVVTVTKNNPVFIAIALAVGAGVGGFVAYKFTKKRLEAQFEDELREQLAAAASFRRRLAKEDYPTPEAAAQALIPEDTVVVPDSIVETVEQYQGKRPVPYNKPEEIVPEEKPAPPVVVENVTVVTNVFEEHKQDPRDWDYNLEVADREANPGQPYVISHEEFAENPDGHEQATLTYFAEDDTLCDSRQSPIDDTERTVGDDNLQRFGAGSGDPNVVYIRNENTEMDFEVIRSNGSYHKEVLGLDEGNSLQHSYRPSRRRRSADE